MEAPTVRPKALGLGLSLGIVFSSLVVSTFASDTGFNCNCDDEGFWSVQSILECQKVSDFLIAVAYFSIPIELLYFISFSNVPFKWVLVQFIAFIVLCGLTHLLNGWTYYGPHSFQLMMSLTIAKFLTALVSCATAITLLPLIPLLLKIKVRELFLRQSVMELDQEVGMMKRQKETSWHVRMLTQEIRKSLDKHNILYTTLVELSKTLDLHNCVVWMPNVSRMELNLTHELKPRPSKSYHRSISINNPDVKEIRESKGVRILRPDSALAGADSGMPDEMGSVVAIRMPMLRGSNFKGGTPEFVDTNYGILVLVLPSARSGDWSYQEMEIVEVVADQVAVALSHAAILEESQLMREKLAEQNRALQMARKNAMMANQARNSFQKVMSHGMRRPMHSIMGILSILQQEVATSEQKLIIDTMTNTGNVLSTLINDVMEIPAKDGGKFPFDMRPFHLHSLIKEASCLAKCLCIYKGFDFSVNVQRSLPDQLMGDERRTFQVILHMVGYLLDIHEGGGSVSFCVSSANGSEGRNPATWGLVLASACIYVKFEFEISSGDSRSDVSIPIADNAGTSCCRNDKKDALSFNVCKKLVQMMQGNIWIDSNSQGIIEKMTLVLRFNMQPAWGRALLPQESMLERQNLSPLFRNIRVVVADDDDVNRTVSKKLLEKLGCLVTAVSSGFECLSAMSNAENSFRIVILDLHLHDIDGFEVATRIRKFRGRNWPIIIALTASAEERIREKCIQMGMNGLIRKPVVLQGMADELRRHLHRAGETV